MVYDRFGLAFTYSVVGCVVGISMQSAVVVSKYRPFRHRFVVIGFSSTVISDVPCPLMI